MIIVILTVLYQKTKFRIFNEGDIMGDEVLHLKLDKSPDNVYAPRLTGLHTLYYNVQYAGVLPANGQVRKIRLEADLTQMEDEDNACLTIEELRAFNQNQVNVALSSNNAVARHDSTLTTTATYGPASFAIDGDDATFNHTHTPSSASRDLKESWLEVELKTINYWKRWKFEIVLITIQEVQTQKREVDTQQKLFLEMTMIKRNMQNITIIGYQKPKNSL